MDESKPNATPQVAPGAEEERAPVVFAPRIDTALRQQVEGLRGVTGQTVNEVGVEALTGWVAMKLADPTIREKAMAEIDAEQRRLNERRASIEGVLGLSATVESKREVDSTRPAGKRGSRSENS